MNEVTDLLDKAKVPYEVRSGSKHVLVYVNGKIVATLSRRPKGGRHEKNSIAMVKRYLRREGLLK